MIWESIKKISIFKYIFVFCLKTKPKWKHLVSALAYVKKNEVTQSV